VPDAPIPHFKVSGNSSIAVTSKPFGAKSTLFTKKYGLGNSGTECLKFLLQHCVHWHSNFSKGGINFTRKLNYMYVFRHLRSGITECDLNISINSKYWSLSCELVDSCELVEMFSTVTLPSWTSPSTVYFQ
jgi:hypothetical protein